MNTLDLEKINQHAPTEVFICARIITIPSISKQTLV